MLYDWQMVNVDPDISFELFEDVLRVNNSPAFSAARMVYDYCVMRRVSPAALLAMFRHESGFGLQGTAVITHSWGNTRQPTFGGVPVVRLTLPHEARSGQFPVFKNWVDGGISTAARWLDHAPYHGQTSVRQIIPIWAPASDLNTPRTYIEAMLKDIALWTGAQEAQPMVTIRDSFIPVGNSNRPGTQLQGGRPRYITIHETANMKAGANAEMHRRYTHGSTGWGGGGHPARWVNGVFEPADAGVSFHYVVDDKEAVHLLPDDEIGYHAGDGVLQGSGGATSIGIETCVNSDGDFAKTLDNLVQLVSFLMQRHNIPIENVVQHNHWSGKDCPFNLRANGAAGWNKLISDLRTALGFPNALQANGATRLNGVDFGGTLIRVERVAVEGINGLGGRYSRQWNQNNLDPWILIGNGNGNGAGMAAGGPSFPGALQTDGRTVINGVDFEGTLASVERVAVEGINGQDERYSREWDDGALAPWVKLA